MPYWFDQGHIAVNPGLPHGMIAIHQPKGPQASECRGRASSVVVMPLPHVVAQSSTTLPGAPFSLGATTVDSTQLAMPSRPRLLATSLPCLIRLISFPKSGRPARQG